MIIGTRRRSARLVTLCLGSAAIALVPSMAFGADAAPGTIRAAIGSDGSVQSVKQVSASGAASAFSGKLPVTMTISHTTSGGQTTYTYHVENTTSQTQTIHYTDTAGNDRHTSATVQLPLVAQLGVDVPASMTNLTAANAAITTSSDGTRHVLWQMVLFAPLGSPTQDVAFTVGGSGTPVAELRATTVDPSTAAGLSAAAQDAQASFQQDDFWKSYASGGAGGLSKLAAGATQLYQGLNQGLAGTNAAASGATQLYDGSKQAYSGSKKLTAGMVKIHGGLSQLADKTNGLPAAESGAQQLRAGVEKVLAGIGNDKTSNTLINGADQIYGGLAQITAALGPWDPKTAAQEGLAFGIRCAQDVVDLVVNGNANDANFPPVGADPCYNAAAPATGAPRPTIAALSTVPGAGFYSLLLSNTLSQALTPIAAGVHLQLLPGFTALRDGAKLLRGGLSTGDMKHPGVKEGLQQIDAGLGKLATGLGAAVGGINQLDAGTGPGPKQELGGLRALTGGLNKIQGGLQQLSSGLVSGAKSFPAAVSGAQQIAAGVKAVNAQAVGPLNTQLGTASQNQHQKLAVLDAAASLASSAPGGSGTSYVLTQNTKDFALAAASSPSHTGRNVGIGLGGLGVLLVGLLGGFALGRQRRVVTTV